jgi:hypothetical protein
MLHLNVACEKITVEPRLQEIVKGNLSTYQGNKGKKLRRRL